MNRHSLRVLHLEASDADHERVRRHAEAAGLGLRIERAADCEAFEAALRRGDIDLILADDRTPGLDGLAALARAQSELPGVPFIVVAGPVGEDRAAECLVRGALDFVHKERLERLQVAVARALGAARGPGTGAGAPEAHQMAFVGRLAGSVAHEFNNLLTIISGYVSMLLDREPLPPATDEALKRVFIASRQATGLVRQLMLFSREETPRMAVVDLNTEAELMAAVLRKVLGESIRVAFEASPQAPRVRADVNMIEQALMNLAANARDAMPRGGRLDLSVSVIPAGGAGAHPEACACLTVRDTGCGIPPENLPLLFRPLYTTKGDGRGTGLGLATAQDIVARHGGWIGVESEVGAGTAFRIHLPLTDAPPTETPEPGASRAAREGKRTLLLVEDEAAVREFAAAVLQQDGYALLQAKSAEAALEVWKWHAERIHLLLTDVVLPGELSGPQLAERLQAEKPGLRVVFATGYDRDIVSSLSRGPGPLNVLNKPYTPRTLLQAVQEALA